MPDSESPLLFAVNSVPALLFAAPNSVSQLVSPDVLIVYSVPDTIEVALTSTDKLNVFVSIEETL